MICGRLSISALVIVITACTAAGINAGSICTSADRISAKSCDAVSNSVGSRRMSCDVNAPTACGSAAATDSSTGAMLSTTAPNASATLADSRAMSAPELPRPAVSDDTDAFSKPSAPDIVLTDSFAKFSAYCSVVSKNIRIAISSRSAPLADAQTKSNPLPAAYASIVVAFIATPRLSIIVKLPFAAPATAFIASSMLIPITDAISAARCIA